MKKLATVIALTLAAVGCKSDNPPLTGTPMPPPPAIERGKVTDLGEIRQITFDPRVDILFVIDDSASMKAHQENLSRNVKSFVNELAKVKAIDFHIGYTVAHDRSRYGTLVPEVCGGRSEPNWEPVGSLRSLKGPADKLPKDGRRFVTRADDFNEILKQTLDPNVNKSLVKELINTKANPVADGCGYGPEEEELFSPIVGLLEDPTRAAGPNKGFRRDGAYFVVIIVSDAKSADVNYGLDPDTVKKRIAQATSGSPLDSSRFRVLTVGMKTGVRFNQSTCKPDPAFGVWDEASQKTLMDYNRVVEPGENPLEELARLTQDENSSVDQVLSICNENYGDELLKYGAQIKKDTLSDVELQLEGYPQVFDDEKDPRNLRVLINDKPLDRSLWKYTSQTGNSQGGVVTIYGQKVDWDKFPNAKIQVTFTPVELGAETTKPVK
jgi:hypothetical protein